MNRYTLHTPRPPLCWDEPAPKQIWAWRDDPNNEGLFITLECKAKGYGTLWKLAGKEAVGIDISEEELKRNYVLKWVSKEDRMASLKKLLSVQRR